MLLLENPPKRISYRIETAQVVNLAIATHAPISALSTLPNYERDYVSMRIDSGTPIYDAQAFSPRG